MTAASLPKSTEKVNTRLSAVLLSFLRQRRPDLTFSSQQFDTILLINTLLFVRG